MFANIKKLVLTTVAAIVLAGVAPAHAKLASVAAVHNYVQTKWGVSITYPAARATNIPNMTYLMQLVDAANLQLNGFATSAYADDLSLATNAIAAATAAKEAVDKLIQAIDWKFFFRPETDGNTFNFKIGAAGTFYVDWGDGTGKVIQKTTATTETISHTYDDAATNYEIKLGGFATEYSTSELVAAISFYDSGSSDKTYRLKSMRGCLGCVFSTIDDETVAAAARQPRFNNTFRDNSSLAGNIPEKLFDGIHGAPTEYMFFYTFAFCKSITGEIPQNLFAGIKGAPADYMFSETFYGCSGLTGGIPATLFAGIKGEPARSMFARTFQGCSSLKGNIPANLFAGIEGEPADNMFEGTFISCSGLTGGIPENLFSKIEGEPASSMFLGTFIDCKGLTGAIPENLFLGIKGAPAASMFSSTFSGCSGLTSIPENLFAGIKGAPANGMFSTTFQSCTGIKSIPENLFAGITPTGSYSYNMFNYTFNGCTNLTGPSPKIGGKALYEIWTATSSQNTFTRATGLVDYDCIPTNWGGGGTLDPSVCTPKFFFTPANDTDSFIFIILNAKGTFIIDWGDGNMTKINENIIADMGESAMDLFSHTYTDGKPASAHTIGLGGRATDYMTLSAGSVFNPEYAGLNAFGSTALLLSYGPTLGQLAGEEVEELSELTVKSIEGCLGCVFPTLSDGRQPIFTLTFAGAPITSIPENLFDGITGAPGVAMFYGTFMETRITEIPENLFAGISGASQPFMFYGTFSGTPIKKIPEKLFAGISPTGGYQRHMFKETFANCTSLTGPSAKIGGEYLYEIWPSTPDPWYEQNPNQSGWGKNQGTYYNASGLSDYELIPSNWKDQ